MAFKSFNASSAELAREQDFHGVYSQMRRNLGEPISILSIA
jgi:hypothetical protein